MVCPLRRERFVHLSRKRLFESDRIRNNQEKEREGSISVTRTRDYGEGETDERNWRKTKKSAGGKWRRRGGRRSRKREGSAGYYVNCLGTLIRNVPKFCKLMLGNAVRRASWCIEKRYPWRARFLLHARDKTHQQAIISAMFSRDISLSLSLAPYTLTHIEISKRQSNVE